MGLRQAYGRIGFERAVMQHVQAQRERERRRATAKRLDVYQDRYLTHLLDAISRTFASPQVRDEIVRFAPLAVSNSLLKRIANDMARPIYAIPPRRRVEGDGGAYGALVAELDINRVMDAAIKLVVAVNDVILFPRTIAGVGIVIDVITGANAYMITHPEAAQVPVALVYPRRPPAAVVEGLGWVDQSSTNPYAQGPVWYTVWDDEMSCLIGESGELVGEPVEHGMGRVPWVSLHRSVPTTCFWNIDDGEDLVAGAIQVAMLNALTLKLHKWQGEKTLAWVGDSPPAQQVLDAGGIIQFPAAGPGGGLQQLDLVTSATHYLETKAEIETTLAANYGISRQRLNQVDKGGDDVALRERTAELMQVARAAEVDLFDVLRRIAGRIPASATITVDFGQLEARVDRKTQLEIWEKERQMGLGSVVDNLAWDNPEAQTTEDLQKILAENMKAEAAFIEARRALNIPADASMTAPGQDAAANGAMGPAVRDGKMTKDQAAEIGRKGPTVDAHTIALRVLKGGR